MVRFQYKKRKDPIKYDQIIKYDFPFEIHTNTFRKMILCPCIPFLSFRTQNRANSSKGQNPDLQKSRFK